VPDKDDKDGPDCPLPAQPIYGSRAPKQSDERIQKSEIRFKNKTPQVRDNRYGDNIGNKVHAPEKMFHFPFDAVDNCGGNHGQGMLNKDKSRGQKNGITQAKPKHPVMNEFPVIGQTDKKGLSQSGVIGKPVIDAQDYRGNDGAQEKEQGGQNKTKDNQLIAV
jgi:hypothetical protein